MIWRKWRNQYISFSCRGPFAMNSVTFQESVSKTSSDSGLLSKRPKYNADSLLFWNPQACSEGTGVLS